MIKLINRIVCRFNGHDWQQAGTCPFTGSTYDYCHKCETMLPRDLAE